MKFTGQSLESYSSKSVQRNHRKSHLSRANAGSHNRGRLWNFLVFPLVATVGHLDSLRKGQKTRLLKWLNNEYVKKVYKGSHRFFFHDNKTPRKRVTGQVKTGRKSENQTEKIRWLALSVSTVVGWKETRGLPTSSRPTKQSRGKAESLEWNSLECGWYVWHFGLHNFFRQQQCLILGLAMKCNSSETRSKPWWNTWQIRPQ